MSIYLLRHSFLFSLSTSLVFEINFKPCPFKANQKTISENRSVCSGFTVIHTVSVRSVEASQVWSAPIQWKQPYITGHRQPYITDFLFSCGCKFPCVSELLESRSYFSSSSLTRCWIKQLWTERQQFYPGEGNCQKRHGSWPDWGPQPGCVQADVWSRGSRKSSIKQTGHPAWGPQVNFSLNSHLEPRS